MPHQALATSSEKTKEQVASRDSRPDSASSFQRRLHPVAHLQRTLGNRNTTRLVQARRVTPAGRLVGVPRIGGVSDARYEQEADSPADRPDAAAATLFPAASTVIQRRTEKDHEEDAPEPAGTRPRSIQRDEGPSTWDQAVGAASSVVSDVADAVLPAGLLDSARAAVDTVKQKAESVVGLGDAAASTATSESQTIEGDVQSRTDSKIVSNQQQGEEEAATRQAQANDIQGAVESRKTGADVAASSISSVQAIIGTVLNPAAPVLDLPGLLTGPQMPDLTVPIPEDISNLGRDIGDGVKQGLGEGGTPGWDCDAAEIVAIAGNVEKALTKSVVSVGKKVLGEDRYNALVQFGSETIAKIEAAANQAKALVENAKNAAIAWWEENVTPYINEIEQVIQDIGEKYDELKRAVSEEVDAALEWAAGEWERLKTGVVDGVTRGIDAAREFIEDKVNWIRNLVKSVWDLLPEWLQTAITGAAAVLAGPAALALAAAQKAADYIAAHKDEILGWIRERVDSVVKGFSEKYAAVRGVLTEVGSTVKGWMTEAGQGIREGASEVYNAIDEATGGRLTAIRQAIADFGQQVKGEACAVLGETVGPCVDQFVPDPGAGGKGFGELTASGELSVTIEGVPVKVSAGAKVSITREGQKYTVVISGEGSLGVSLKGEGGGGGGGSSGSVSLNVDLPAGGKWKAWEKLTGQSAPAGPSPGTGSSPAGSQPAPNVPSAPGAPASVPARPATGAPSTPQGQGQASGAPQGAPAGPSAEVGAGIKGSVEMTYEFDASKDRTSCDGLGGMTALLASQGLAASLPMPFSNLAGQLGQAAFADRLTSCKFSASQYADVSVDLLKGDVGSLKFKVSGERGVEVETARDLQTGEVTQKATLKNELGGSLAGQLATGPVSGLGGSIGLKGSLSLSLAYSPAQELITALDLEAKMTGSVALTNWSQLRSALPANIASTVDAGLQQTVVAGTSGELTVEASFTIKNLHELASQLDAYCSNPEQVSAGGLWAKVTGFIEDPKNREQKFTIVLTETAGMGGVTVGGEGSSQGTGGSVSLGIRRGVTRKRTLYSS